MPSLFLLLNMALVVVLVRLVIQIERPLPPTLIITGVQLFFIPASAYRDPLSLLGLIFSLAFAFAVWFVYFWLLARIRLGTLGWWLVMLTMPILSLLCMLPLQAIGAP